MDYLKHILPVYLKVLNCPRSIDILHIIRDDPGITQRNIIIKLRGDHRKDRKAIHIYLANLIDLGAVVKRKHDSDRTYTHHYLTDGWLDHIKELEHMIKQFRAT